MIEWLLLWTSLCITKGTLSLAVQRKVPKTKLFFYWMTKTIEKQDSIISRNITGTVGSLFCEPCDVTVANTANIGWL